MEELASDDRAFNNYRCGKNGSQAGVRALIIGHFSARYRDINATGRRGENDIPAEHFLQSMERHMISPPSDSW